ncbi:MAG: DNA primase [Eubacteriaceae bacterium]|nr:DNA primase [Eubacteriaceae bacterium]
MATRYSEEFIHKVIDATDFVNIASQYTSLNKKSGRYVGLCPFHNEKTPSFYLDEDKKLYHCFGCQKGGNAVGFVMEMNNMPYIEAIEHLAGLANIPLEKSGDAESDAAYSQKKKIYEINKAAANYYYTQLLRNSQALSYLASRGITAQSVRAFGMGYAPGNQELFKHLKSKDYSESDILASGLVRKNEAGYPRDFFFGRVIFPIQDVSGQMIAFGGRAMGDAQPKYLNSAENAVYQKAFHLYHLYSAKKEIASAPLILVEGYMDVIMLAQHGITNTAASLGTALSAQHAKLIRRYTQTVVLCYDSDSAGIKAATRASDILLETGIEPKIVFLEDGEDPDSYVRKNGAAKFQELVKNAQPATEAKIAIAAGSYNLNDVGERSEFAKIAAVEAAKVGDEVKWAYYSKIIADLARIGEDAASRLISKAYKGIDISDEQIAGKKQSIASEKAQISLINYLLGGLGSFKSFIAAGGGSSIFIDSDYTECYGKIEEFYSSDREGKNNIDIVAALSYNDRIASTLSKAIYSGFSKVSEAEMISSMKALLIAQYDIELGNLYKQLEAAQSKNDIQLANELLNKYVVLKKEILAQKEVKP